MEDLRNTTSKLQDAASILEDFIPKVKQSHEKLMADLVPLEKKDVKFNELSMWAGLHKDGRVSLNFPSIKDAKDFFDSLK